MTVTKSASEGENEKASPDDDENGDDMLRAFKRRKTHATVNSDESDLIKHKLEDANANGAANGHVDTVPNAVEPIRMLSPANTVMFDEPLPLPSVEASHLNPSYSSTPQSSDEPLPLSTAHSDTFKHTNSTLQFH